MRWPGSNRLPSRSQSQSVPVPFYESAEALEQYLFFHYGTARDYLPYPGGPREALDYPARAVRELLDRKLLPRRARALDLGCAVGRTSFELSRYCHEVVGIDLSRAFIRAANQMRRAGAMDISYKVEGDRSRTVTIKRPRGVHPERVRFAVGDAMKLPARLGLFDAAVLLNLIDRVPGPAECLRGLARHLRPGAQLIIASPYTWLDAYTPRGKWLGGRMDYTTFDALSAQLKPEFRLVKRRPIPFLIREHARKFQWSVAEASVWVKR